MVGGGGLRSRPSGQISDSAHTYLIGLRSSPAFGRSDGPDGNPFNFKIYAINAATSSRFRLPGSLAGVVRRVRSNKSESGTPFPFRREPVAIEHGPASARSVRAVALHALRAVYRFAIFGLGIPVDAVPRALRRGALRRAHGRWRRAHHTGGSKHDGGAFNHVLLLCCRGFGCLPSLQRARRRESRPSTDSLRGTRTRTADRRCRFSRIMNVHGCTHVSGSMTVSSQLSSPARARVALDRLSRSASTPGSRCEIRRLDHERVAFPAAARVAVQLPDGRGQMRLAVHRHDARVVDHLLENHDGLRRLHDLHVAVVSRARARRAVRNAALRQRPILRAISAVRAARSPNLRRRPGPRHVRGRARRACASGVSAGIWPFGGSVMSDVRLSQSRSDHPELVVVAGRGIVGDLLELPLLIFRFSAI